MPKANNAQSKKTTSKSSNVSKKSSDLKEKNNSKVSTKNKQQNKNQTKKITKVADTKKSTKNSTKNTTTNTKNNKNSSAKNQNNKNSQTKNKTKTKTTTTTTSTNKNKTKNNNKVTSLKQPNKILKNTLITLVVILALAIVSAFGYYVVNTLVEFPDDQKVEQTIEGLDKVQILNIEIENKDEQSLIKISLFNNSDTEISDKHVHIYLLDKNENVIFGSYLKLPTLKANEQTNFNVLSRNLIKDMKYYRIELED